MTGEVEQEMGQDITILPMRRNDGNGRSAPDPSRESYTFCAMFDWQWSDAQLGERDMEVSTRLPWIFADRNKLRYMPVGKDRFRLFTQGAMCTFEINEIRRDGVSGVIFILNQLGREL